MESTSSSMLAPGLDALGAIDFFQHPDARSVSCFFLGCLFFASIRQFTHSLTTIIFHRSRNSVKAPYHSDVEDPRLPAGKFGTNGFTGESSLPAGWRSVDSRTILLTAVAFCYAIASILEMASLLSFAPVRGASRCGGLVITAGMLEHLATLFAFVYASIDIRRLGSGKWEQRGFFLLIAAAFALQCAEAVLIKFTVNRLPRLAFGFCWRTRPSILCAINAVIGILCGIYVSACLYASVVPDPTFAWRSQIAAFSDVRVARGLSLLSLGLLTFLPGFASFGIAGDIIPLAVASVVVLELLAAKDALSRKQQPDNAIEVAIEVELVPEPLSPTGRSDESNGHATSPKPLSLPATMLMELNGSQTAIRSLSDNARTPTPSQTRRPTESPALMQEPIVPRLAHIMNAAYPPAPQSPAISEVSVPEIATARRVRRPATGTTVGKSVRSARPVSFLTTQNPYPDRGFVPPSPGSAARTEFELTTTEEDYELTRSGTVSSAVQGVSRNPSSTVSHWQGEVSKAAPSASDRWKNMMPVTSDRNERMERSISRRTFGAESQRAPSRAASNRQSVPSTPVSELPPSRPPMPSVYSSKQLPNVPPHS